jgi:hypothetical protein
MSRRTWSGMFTATVFAITGVVMAQAPSTAQNPSTAQGQPPTTSSATQAAAAQTDSANRVTVTGCLREAAAGPTATSGSAASTPGATDAAGKATAAGGAKFVLANAAPSSPNASPADAKPTATQTYQLIANDSALAPHVGKRVELTGTIEGQEAAATATVPPGGAATASASAEPKLRVESGKVIAANCTP